MNDKPMVVVFAGSKGAGKDTAINGLEKVYTSSYIKRLECKEHLIKLTCLFFNITPDDFNKYYENRELKEVPKKRFSIPLEEGRKLFSYLNYTWYDWVSDVYFIDDKGCERFPHNGRYSLSAREAIIYISEIIYKPTMGRDIFGKIRADKYDSSFEGIYVDGSYGFEEELTDLINKVGQNNIIGVRLHKNGCTYSGDSRKPLRDGLLDHVIDVENNNSVEDLQRKVVDIVSKFRKEGLV